MTTLTFSSNVTNPDVEDKRAMEYVINAENSRRTAYNVEVTAYNTTVPPPAVPKVPLTILVHSTANERKAAYELIWNLRMAEVHAKYLKQANEQADTDPAFKDLRPLWVDSTAQKKAAALAALQ